MKDHGLTAREGILLHLLECDRFRDDAILPGSVTQPGIARALDTERSYISFVLTGMERKKLLSSRLGRVEGAGRKRKVYFLEEEGAKLAREMLDLLSGSELSCIKDGEVIEGSLISISQRTGLPVSLLTVMTDPSERTELDEWISNRASKDAGSKGGRGPPVPGNFTGREDEIERIQGWFEGTSPLLQITGIAGTGKTSLVGKVLSDERRENGNILYVSARSWSTEQSVITDLALQLERNGSDTLSLLQKEKGAISLDELRNNLGVESSKGPLILVMDDVQNLVSGGRMEPFLDMIISVTADGLRIILITRDTVELDPRYFIGGTPPTNMEITGLKREDVSKLARDSGMENDDEIFSITSGHPLYVNLYLEHHCADGPAEPRRSIRTFIVNEVLGCLNRTERDMLDLISVIRLPVSREDLFDMDAGDLMVSEAGLQSLIGGGLLIGDEGSLTVHQLVSDILIEVMPRNRKASLHRIMADHYREKMDRSEEAGLDISGRMIAIRELLHHLWICGSMPEKLSVLTDLGEEMMSRSMYGDLEQYSRDLLRSVDGDAGSQGLDRSMTILIMIYNGWCKSVRGSWEKALERYEKAGDLAVEIANRDLQGRCLNAVGSIHLRRGNPAEAGKLISESIEMMNDKRSLCKARSNLAVVNWMEGDLDEALSEVDASLDLAMFLDDAMGVARGLINKGIILAQANDLEGSRSAYEKAMNICTREGFSQTLSIVHDNLGELHRELKDPERSKHHFRKSLELATGLGFKWQMAEAMRNLAALTSHGGERTGLFIKSMDIFRSLGDLGEVERTMKLMNDTGSQDGE